MRYVRRPRSEGPLYGEFFDDDVSLTGQTVLEDDPEWSGLYDADGEPLYRERKKVGFV